jgi:hypothetical protein
MAFEEGTAQEAARRMGLKCGLEINVLVEHGPGGGWPEVELSGDRADVEHALRERWGMDEDEVRSVVVD